MPTTRCALIFIPKSITSLNERLQNADDIPFDLKHQRHIVYGDSISHLKDELEKNLEWAKTEVENYRKSHIRIKVHEIKTDLDKTSYNATAKLDFRIDLFNDSDEPKEILSLSLYSGKDWTIKQNNSICEHLESDAEPYKHQYLLRPFQNKIPKKSRTPLRFKASRIVASGKNLKDEYPVKGHAMLKIATTTDTIEHTITIDTVCEYIDIPF